MTKPVAAVVLRWAPFAEDNGQGNNEDSEARRPIVSNSPARTNYSRFIISLKLRLKHLYGGSGTVRENGSTHGTSCPGLHSILYMS